MSKEKQRMTVYVNKEIYKRFYVKVFLEKGSKSMSAKIEELIRDYVGDK